MNQVSPVETIKLEYETVLSSWEVCKESVGLEENGTTITLSL